MSPGAPVLSHRLEGETGEVVLLLNGGMMTWATWEPVAERLRAEYRVLRCDLRGQLMTPGESHADLDGHVEDVVALLDELGLDAVHVHGTSFGALVGMLLAARRPRRVLTLAAVTTTDRLTPAMRRGIQDLHRLSAAALAGGDRAAFHDRLMDEVYSESYRRAHAGELAERRRQLSRLPDHFFVGLDGILTALESLDLRPHLGEVRCPTLVVVAAQDRTMPPERSRALAAAIADAEVVEHPTSGHALVAEDPEWLAAEYLSFLARLES